MRKSTISDYITKAIQHTAYEYCEETKSWGAYIPQLPGCWAQGTTIEDARSELIEVIEGWLILALQFNDPIPELDGLAIGKIDRGVEALGNQIMSSGRLSGLTKF